MTNTVGDAQIKLGLDASGVVTGIGEAKKSIDSLGASTQKGLGPIAPEMEKASAATQRFAREVVKTEIALLSGGKQTAAYKQAVAELNGLGTGALKPYLESLRATEQAQRAATAATLSGNAALGNMGLTAKQTAAALRQVPAQFTDIIVSLQGGQAPLTVLLQQGGQLKDVFGGAGNAARALGGYVLGLVNPYTVAAAAIGGIAFAFEKGAQEQREFQKALILTGNAAGVTANLLSQAAANIDAVSGATQGKAAEALLVFVNAGIRGSESLERFTASAIEFERAGGGSIEKVAENFSKLGKDPLKASLELNDSMNFLTRSLYEQIKALEDQGKSTDAARLAQEAYNAALNDRTPQLLQNLGLIERGWKAITDATKGAYDAALQIGRTAAPTESQVRAQLESLSGPSPLANEGGSLASRRDRAEALKQELQTKLKGFEFDKAIAAQDERRLQSVKALAEFDKLREQSLDKQVKKQREIVQATELAAKAGVTGKPLDDVIAGINKKYEDKTPSGVADLNRGISAQIEALKQGAAIKAEIARQEADTRSSEFKRGITNVLQFIEQEKQANLESLNSRKSILQEELRLATGKKSSQVEQARLAGQIALNEQEAATVIIKAQNDIAEAKFKQAKAAEAVFQSQKDEDTAARTAELLKNDAARKALITSLYGYGDSLDEANGLADLELKLMGQSAQARIVAIEQFKVEARLKKEINDIDNNPGLNEADKAAAKLKAAENASKAIAIVSKNAALQEFKTFTDALSNSITDALMRGFESGKSASQNLKDTFKNLAKSLVIKPIIEAPVKQFAAFLKPLEKQVTDFVALQILGNQQVAASATAGAATSVAASQTAGTAAATAGIANQAGGDPYTAFFRMAAMAALMAGLGYAVKGANKGNALPASNQGTGTVFGDSTAKSASIDNSLKLLETSRLGLKYSEQMARSLKNIEAAFAGVTNLVLRNGQIGALEGRINAGIQGSSFSENGFNQIVRSVALGGSGTAASLQRRLFGNRVSIQGSGILGGPQSFGDIQDIGFQGNYYADVQTKKKFLGITTSTTNSTALAALDEELARNFTQIFTGMGDSVLSASKVFGLRTETINAALEAYIVDIGKIDLRGLKGDEVEQKLADVFGAEFDKLATAIIPGLESIIQVGEGYGETLVRAATQLESVRTTFDLLGGSLSLVTKNTGFLLEKLIQPVGSVTPGGINQAITADALVQQFGGLEQFNEATNAFYESFYSQGERTRATLGLLSTSLEGIGITLPDSIASWRELTTSLDVTTEAGQQAFEALVTLGPAFADLQNQLLDAAGISGGAIADVLRDGMLGRITQEDVGAKLSSIVIDGIYNSLANGFAEQISNTFTNQIIAPLLQSVATGGVLSASISQASIDAVVASATNAANQLAAILGDAGFQSAIAGVQAAIDGIAGALPGKAVTAATQSYASLGGAVSTASDAAAKGVDAWKSIGDSITNEIDRIRGVLTGGDKASALASFATLTAQTRARDLEAGKLLPGASQAYIKAVEESASSLLDIRRAQGFALSSLLETRSIIGQGPAVSSPTSFTPNFTPSYSTGGAAQNNDALITEVKLLRAEVAALKPYAQTTAEVLDKAAKAGDGSGAFGVEVQA